MAENSFSASVSAWAKKTKWRQEAVFKESAQCVIEIAQEPVSEGGNMPTITGFLRSSGKATLGEPTFQTVANPGGTFTGGTEQTTAIIAGATISSTISFVWTAVYAPYVEARRGFLRLAVQSWPQIVAKVCAELKERNP
jgi:hypothetical protein